MATVPHAYGQDTRIKFTRHNYELVTLIVLTEATMIARNGAAASGPPAKKIWWLVGKKDYFEQFMLGKLRFIVSRWRPSLSQIPGTPYSIPCQA
jgi:hypothetical protein